MFPRFALNMNNFEVRNGEVTIVGETKGTGPHVVCITGWANNRDVWSGLSENLCKDHQVTTWDLRGHGESGAPPPGNYEREEALKDISAVLDEVGRPCVLVGHSLGGYLSLAYALERPDEVSALVLVASGPGFRKVEAREEWNESVRQAAMKLDLAEGAVTGINTFMILPKVSSVVGLGTTAGAMMFNTATSKFQGFTGAAWVDLH